jgi:hypothetical protein
VLSEIRTGEKKKKKTSTTEIYEEKEEVLKRESAAPILVKFFPSVPFSRPGTFFFLVGASPALKSP